MRRPLKCSGKHVALAATLALFVASRAALLLTSSAANQNWEEPVFLFSSLELQRVGLANAWDYQDDLDHGGSLPLIVLGALWLQWWEPAVLSLKWLVLAWWSATFVVYLWVVASVFSWRAAVVGGLFWLGASPNLARLQVTLVGSHPEGILPALCASALVASAREPRLERAGRIFLAAWLATVAAWMSYLLAPWALAVIAALLWRRGPRRKVLAVAGAVALGASPWLYQNLYRHPRPWWRWVERAFPKEGAASTAAHGSPLGMLAYFGDAWGGPLSWGCVLVLVALALLLVAALLARVPGAAPIRAKHAAWTLLLACLLSSAALVAGRIVPLPNEGYYFTRFFAPLQVLLLILAAGGSEIAAQIWGGRFLLVAALVALGVGVYQLAPLYGQGVARADFRQEWLRGCLVFGIAEYPRAGSAEAACARLSRLDDPACRERAFNGLGWGVADEFLRHGNLEPASRALACANDPGLRRALCGGMHFVFARSQRGPLPFPPALEAACRS